MSRVGKKIIEIPQGVKVSFSDGILTVQGPKGELKEKIHSNMQLEITDKTILVKRPNDSNENKALHGMTRNIINNMVQGVVKEYEVILDIVGVGYKADIQGNNLSLTLGYSHPIQYKLPEGIKGKVEKNTRIIVMGCNKQLVGQIASDIRRLRPPDIYKGKGIRYADEYIKLKPGKTGAKG